MFRTLRNRLIFSHILPSLIVIPLLGLAMLYLLETRLLLPLVYRNLAADARLMAEITRTNSVYWSDPAVAQALVSGASPYLSGKLSLINLDGKLLASDDVVNASVGSQVVELPSLAGLNPGDVIELQRGPSAEVYTPVISTAGQRLGVLRMSTRVVTVLDEIYQLRYLLGIVLVVAILAGIVLGSYLAVSISRPVQQVSSSIDALAKGDWNTHIEEKGPEETRLLARSVNTLVDRLHSLEQARRQLLANLVHELGRPLGAFRSAIQALLKGAAHDPELAHELLDGLDGEAIRMQHLLDDLARLHDQVLGTLELRRQPLDLLAWLPGIMAPWKAAANQKGLNWREELPADLPQILADSDRLAQALSNLLSNAVKFTPPGGSVVVAGGFNNERVWLSVRDSGSGISAEEQQKIFQPFFRGGRGRRIVQGMGLGLTIARDIAVAHGGGIDVLSQVEQGSIFTLWLPHPETLPAHEA